MTQTVYKIYKSEKFPGSKEHPWIVGRNRKAQFGQREATSRTAVLVNIRKFTKVA